MSENYGFTMGYDFNDDQRLTYKFTRANYDWKYKDSESYERKEDGSTSWSGTLHGTNGSNYTYSPSSFLGTRGWRSYNMHSLTYNDQKIKFMLISV